jgi:predicted O-methyltransferase YrrM
VLKETQVRAWIDATLPCEIPGLTPIRSRTEDLGLPHEEMFPSQVMLLRTLMLALQAREVLELGTFLGHGVAGFVHTLDALGGGRLTTVDRDVELSREARAGLPIKSTATIVEFRTGDAAAVCEELLDAGRQFDLVLLDVAEVEYPTLYERCIALMRSGGLLVVDNVMMATAAGWESGENVVEGPASVVLEALRALIAMAAHDSRIWPALVPLGSGLLLCAKQ